ncbi:MAG: AI-2E family transporter [Patescibacteria group bacterium]
MQLPPPSTNITISTGTIIKVLGILFVAFALYYLRDIVLIVLTAVVIASAIEPGTKWLVRRRIPRLISVIIIYIILLTFIGAFFYFIAPSFVQELSDVMQMLPTSVSTVDIAAHPVLSQNFSPVESIGTVLQDLIGGMTSDSGAVLATIIAIFGGALSFLLTLVISFYLAVQEKGVEDFLRLVLPLKHEEYIINLWHRTQHKIGIWMQGQLILAVIVGVLVFISLTILGVKNALFLAFVSMIFEIIPVFGGIIGALPGVLVAFLQGGLTFGIIIALVYLAIQQIESNIIYPVVVRKILNVPPLVVIIALLIGSKAGGFLGVLISVPIAVALTEFMSDVEKNRGVAREKRLNVYAEPEQ